MIDSMDEAAHRLYQHMLRIFEEVEAEDGKEWVLWDALARYWSSKQGQYQPPSRYPRDITEHMADLNSLVEQADGWFWWVRYPNGHAPMPRFVPLKRWLWLVSLRGTDMSGASNEELHAYVPESLGYPD